MRTFIVIIIILAGILISYFWFFNDPEVTGMSDVTNTTSQELVEYFQERMFDVAITRSGGLQPIEGYDADLLMGAYPGLEINDFKGVESFEGHYEVENNELVFERDASQSSISTAEKTISTQGYETLLKNVSNRLRLVPRTEQDIDDIIEIL